MKEEVKFRKITRYGNSLKSNKFICFYCSCKLDEYSRTVDHLVPASRGGIRSNDNKVYSCRKCNQLKANMMPEEFSDYLQSLIKYEIDSHRERVGYLKKVSLNVKKLIQSKNDRSKSSETGYTKKDHSGEVQRRTDEKEDSTEL